MHRKVERKTPGSQIPEEEGTATVPGDVARSGRSYRQQKLSACRFASFGLPELAGSRVGFRTVSITSPSIHFKVVNFI